MKLTLRDRDKIREGIIEGRRKKSLEVAKSLLTAGMDELKISELVHAARRY